MLRPLIKGLWKVTHFARSAKVSNLFWYFWFYPENLSYWKRQIKEIDEKRGGNAWCALEVPGFVEIWAWKVWVIFTFRSQLHCKRKVTFACILGQLFLFCPLGKISPFVLLWMYLGFELFLFTLFFSFLFFFFFLDRGLIFHLLKDLQEKEIIYAPLWKSTSLFIPLHFTGKYVIPFRSMN